MTNSAHTKDPKQTKSNSVHGAPLQTSINAERTSKVTMRKVVKVNVSSRVKLTERDLPLSCPMPQMSLWNMHPKVYLATEAGEAICPYCGTKYLLDEDE